MKELKKPLTVDEQIAHLKENRNLVIDDIDYARSILSKINYYRLFAYGRGLRKTDEPDKYKDGTSIEQIYSLYRFDQQLKSILLLVIENIEIIMRTQIAHQIAFNYGAEGYLDPKNFNDKKKENGASVHKIIIDNFNSERERQKSQPFVRHHEEEYGGRYPIWVAMELFSFGKASSLYSIMKETDQNEISKKFSTKPDILSSWLISLVEVRNICAHCGRLYNMPLKSRPKLYREHSAYANARIPKLFPVLIALKYMIGKSNTWKKFLSELLYLIDECGYVNLSFMGFPTDWYEILSAQPVYRTESFASINF